MSVSHTPQRRPEPSAALSAEQRHRRRQDQARRGQAYQRRVTLERRKGSRLDRSALWFGEASAERFLDRPLGSLFTSFQGLLAASLLCSLLVGFLFDYSMHLAGLGSIGGSTTAVAMLIGGAVGAAAGGGAGGRWWAVPATACATLWVWLRRARPARCRIDARGAQDLIDGRRRNGHAEPGQLAVDPPVTPQRVLPRQADGDPGNTPHGRRAAGPAARARFVLPRDQPAVPSQQRRGRHREDPAPPPPRDKRGCGWPGGWSREGWRSTKPNSQRISRYAIFRGTRQANHHRTRPAAERAGQARERVFGRHRGRVGGRKPKLTADQIAVARQLYDAREHTVEQIGSMGSVFSDLISAATPTASCSSNRAPWPSRGSGAGLRRNSMRSAVKEQCDVQSTTGATPHTPKTPPGCGPARPPGCSPPSAAPSSAS
jgi:hypothetical protein